MQYSANSVLQDNRKGAMKYDYVLVFNILGETKETVRTFNKINGWRCYKPF